MIKRGDPLAVSGLSVYRFGLDLPLGTAPWDGSCNRRTWTPLSSLPLEARQSGTT